MIDIYIQDNKNRSEYWMEDVESYDLVLHIQ